MNRVLVKCTRTARTARSVAAVLVLAGGCSTSGRSKPSASRPSPPSTTAGRASRAQQGAPLAQFTPAEAARMAVPTGADAAALAALARGAPPTLPEVVARRNEMGGAVAPVRSPSPLPASVRAQLDAARSAARRYPTAADAARAGYRLASRFIPGIGAHWIKWQLVTAPFDAAEPSMLLFAGNGTDAPLAGLSYYTESTGEPAAFTAGGARWHRHIGVCIVHGVLVGEGITAPSACAGGLLLPGRNMWMLHVWVVPGRPNANGVFAPVNPALCTAAAPCAPTSK